MNEPIHLNDSQEALIKQWAADDRLWTTQETVEFNLHIFTRSVLKGLREAESLREQALRSIKAVHTRFCRGEMTAENAVDEMEAIAVSVWQREWNAGFRFPQNVNADLLEACKRLLEFNEELCEDMKVSKHYPSADFARRVIAEAAIAEAG